MTCFNVAFNCTEDENAVALSSLHQRAWLALRAKIDEQAADNVILGKLRSHFEERFRYDDQGVPRVWQPDDDIDGEFRKAKEQTLALIPLYSKISPVDPSLEYTPPPPPSDTTGSSASEEDFDFPSSLIIFSEFKSLDITARFRRDADAYYVEAKRSTVSSIAQVPYWMYGIMVVLGWNEAMLVLFNPLYFMMSLAMATAAYVIAKLGLTGPLLQLSKTVATEIQQQASNRLREHFSQPVLERPIRAEPIRASSMQATSTNSTTSDYFDTDAVEDEPNMWKGRTAPL